CSTRVLPAVTVISSDARSIVWSSRFEHAENSGTLPSSSMYPPRPRMSLTLPSGSTSLLGHSVGPAADLVGVAELLVGEHRAGVVVGQLEAPRHSRRDLEPDDLVVADALQVLDERPEA